MNEADALRAAAVLELMGFHSVSNVREASLLLLNTCVVRQQAEDKAYGAQKLGAEDEDGKGGGYPHLHGEGREGGGEAVASEPAENLLGAVGEDDAAESHPQDETGQASSV